MKRYNSLNKYFNGRFGNRVVKVSLNAGFTCPNKDGNKGFGGCTYCSPLGSGDFAGEKTDDLLTQFEKVKDIMSLKWPDAKYIAYFQANTNTYAPVSDLKSKFEKILNYSPDIIGLAISTRPDALPADVVEYLGELNERTNLFVELGLQTIHETTSQLINRGHTLREFDMGLQALRNKNIETIVHIIDGLPYETPKMMLDTANYLAMRDIQGIKIHSLHVIKNTKMGRNYLQAPFPLLTKDEYVDIVVRQLEVLNPKTVIHRLTGDAVRNELIAPEWSLKKWETLNAIDEALEARNTYQGRLYDAKNT